MNKTIVERGTALAQDMSVFGKKLTNMDRHELIAVAAIGWNRTITMQERAKKERRELFELVNDMRVGRRRRGLSTLFKS